MMEYFLGIKKKDTPKKILEACLIINTYGK